MHGFRRIGSWFLVIGLLTVTPAQAQPAEEPSEQWSTAEGQVVFADHTTITLMTDSGTLLARTQGWNWHAERRLVNAGDTIKVEGYPTQEGDLDARVLYVKDRNTYYYNMGENGEDVTISLVPGPVTLVWLELTGIVADTKENGLVVQTGRREIDVDTTELPFDPLAWQGPREISVGDVVTIAGKIEYDLFDKRPLIASRVENMSHSGVTSTQD